MYDKRKFAEGFRWKLVRKSGGTTSQKEFFKTIEEVNGFLAKMTEQGKNFELYRMAKIVVPIQLGASKEVLAVGELVYLSGYVNGETENATGQIRLYELEF